MDERMFVVDKTTAKALKMYGPHKRHRKMLTLLERIAIIKMGDTESVRTLATKFDCCPQTISEILRNKDDYLKDWEDRHDPSRGRREHLARLLAHRQILYLWVQRCQSYPIRITDDIIREKGVEIARFVGLPGLRIFNAWIRNFKRKFKLKDEDLFNNDIINNTDESEHQSLNIEDIIADMKDSGPISRYNIYEFTKRQLPATPIIYAESNQNMSEVYISENDESDLLTTGINESTMWSDSFESMAFNTDEANPPSNFPFQITEVRSLQNLPLKEDSNNGIKEIKDYKEALNKLGLLENFLLLKENIRAVGLVNQLENIFRDAMSKS